MIRTRLVKEDLPAAWPLHLYSSETVLTNNLTQEVSYTFAPLVDELHHCFRTNNGLCVFPGGLVITCLRAKVGRKMILLHMIMMILYRLQLQMNHQFQMAWVPSHRVSLCITY